MKWFLITLAIGLTVSDKLDRTYLPPPGAQHAGGNLGDHDAPLAPPYHSYTGSEHNVDGQEGSLINFGLSGEPVNFGDKIPKVPFNYNSERGPTTTTSYAFSQTTTYPTVESYETTALPINPVTGLPVTLDQANYPFGSSQGQQIIPNLPDYTQNQSQGVPVYGTNLQPGSGTQSPTSAPFGTPGYYQPVNQPSQYAEQNVIIPGDTAQIPESVYQENTLQQGSLPTAATGSQGLDQYPQQNVVIPGGTIQIPVNNQGFVQYPGGQSTKQQGFVPSTVSSLNLQPGNNQYGVNYEGSQSPTFQGTYTGQPINVQDQAYQGPFRVGNIPSQYPTANENLASGLSGSNNVYQPGSTTTVLPSSYYDGVSSTTPNPGFPSSTSVYFMRGLSNRPERPQAAADRNAVILNYENIRTPNGYSYSFDTSNGIHADESGIVDNGTKAQGAYSYTGDDGKVYSVIYTADENGFQPRGDHLPTPPPIPEAIQRVIEQAARDKAAGIFDDGSYDEAKYGDNQYKIKGNRRRPQNKNGNRLYNKQVDGELNKEIKPVAGINNDEYDESLSQDQFGNKLPGTQSRLSGVIQSKRPLNPMNGENIQDNSEANRRTSDEGVAPFAGVYKNNMPIKASTNNQYVTKDLDSSRQRPMFIGNALTSTGAGDGNKENTYGSNQDSSRRPNLDRHMQTGSQKEYGETNDYPETEKDRFNARSDQNRSSSPGRPDSNVGTNTDTVSDAPISGKINQNIRERVKGNKRPSKINDINNRNKTPQGENLNQEHTETPFFSDYVINAANQPSLNQATQQDETGYSYQEPKIKFEQNKFPSRFSPQVATSTTRPDQSGTEFVKGSTRKPFVTPNVYGQNDGSRQSTTRRPFMTVGVTSPTESSYTDYDDGDDYETDQNGNDDGRDSTGPSDGKNRITPRPYQSAQTSSIPQYVTQKGTPGNLIENSGSVTPGYLYGSTTPMPSHSSRFGNTETPQSIKPLQGEPSNPSSTTALGRPLPSPKTTPLDYNYQTTRPTGSNVVSGYPSLDSLSTTPGVLTPQNYATSTSIYGPSPGFFSTTMVPATSRYSQELDLQNSSKTAGLPQSSPTGTFQTGYHYGPPKFGNFGTLPISPTSGYQTTYEQGPNGYQSTTSSPGRPTIYFESQPGYAAPESSPFGTYQGNLQNGPSKPDFSTTIVSSIPEGSPVFGYPGFSGATNPQPTGGYQYGSSRPAYPTESSSTAVTTPGSFIPSGTVSTTQGYPTTYGPSFQATKDTFATGPVVDGFGRPITTEQGGSHPGISHQAQASPMQENNGQPNFNNGQSTSYPGSYDQSRVIGEDFSGPKQPQRYDPKTGYHYK